MNPFYTKTFDVSPGTSVGSLSLENQYLLVEQGFDSVNVQLLLRGSIAGQAWTGTHNFTGATVTFATQAAGDNTTLAATTAHVFAERTNVATLTNKTLTTPVITAPTGLVKGDVGLGSVDNTPDANKPVSAPQQAALDLKANLASPTFTGTPAAPTPGSNVNTTQVVTGEWVNTWYAPKASPTFTGNVTVPQPTAATDAANKAYIDATQNAATTPLWVSGTNYQRGNAVFSPLSLQSYRCDVAGVSTVDPRDDSVTWVALGTQLPGFILMSQGVI
jgi:hypothetical protein